MLTTQVYNYVAGSTSSYSSQAPNLYNGNIKHMVTSIWEGNGSGGGAIQPQLTAYNYDQLNRITNMHGYRNLVASTNQWNNTVPGGGISGDAYKSSYTYDANGNIKTLNRAGVNGAYFDQLNYKYDERPTTGGATKLESNKLYTVIDPATPLANTASQPIEDIKTMAAFVPYDAANPATFKNNNFYYDEIGNLIQDKSSHIDNIEWNAYGKIRKITFDATKNDLAFEYDASGNRTAKIEQTKDQTSGTVLAPTQWKYTYYVHDAKGNIMSVYEKNPTLVVGGVANDLIQTQVPIYGSSRIGLYDPEVDLTTTTTVSSTFARRFLKQKQYELTNHLGNVLTTISDRKLKNASGAIAYSAEIISAQDYYPFGMIMPGRNYNSDNYRFGVNGMEKDDEMKGVGNSLDFGARMYDTRIGRWLSVDPILNPSQSTFSSFDNNPIYTIDPNGKSGKAYIRGNTVIVESQFYFYGTKLKNEDAHRIAENIQKMWNSANGKVTIDDKEYNVKFKITATAIVKKANENDEDYTMRVGKKMIDVEKPEGGTYNDNIKNNWVRIDDENPSDKYGTKTSQNSGFWLTSDADKTDASHEYWEGLNMTGEDHLKDCSGDGARIRCAENGKIDGDTRIVTQDDINDLKLGEILSGGKVSAPVGFFGNALYRKNGSHEVVGDTKEKNARLKSERGQ